MECTFEAFKQRMMENIKVMKGWELAVQENSFTQKNKQHNKEYQTHYQNCESLTEKMNTSYANPCYVYRVQNKADGILTQERYDLVLLHNEQAIKLSLFLKTKEGVHRPIWMWHKLDEKNNLKEELEETTELENFRFSLIDWIKELPEFRLYAVTGVWE